MATYSKSLDDYFRIPILIKNNTLSSLLSAIDYRCATRAFILSKIVVSKVNNSAADIGRLRAIESKTGLAAAISLSAEVIALISWFALCYWLCL